MSYPQGAEGGAIPKERCKDGSPYKDLDETMDPDMKSVHVQKTEFPTPSCESTRTMESDGELSILKNLNLRSASHMSMSVQSAQSGNSSRYPSDDGDQTRDERITLERPLSPTPSYLSMKSDTSMATPLFFKEGNLTQKEEPRKVVCDICEVKAVKSCLTCNQYYCETHVKKHYTAPKLQRHTLVEVTGDLEERLCQEHHRALEVFCKTDQKMICFECSVTKHNGHEIISYKIQQAGRQTQDEDHDQSQTLIEVLPPPGEIQFLSVTSDSVSLSWSSPRGVKGPQKFRVTWECTDGEKHSLDVKYMHQIEIDGLKPGEQYQFNVATEGDDGSLSRCVSRSVFTVVPAPRDLNIDQLEDTSFTLSWTKAEGMDKVAQRFLMSYWSPGTEPKAIHTEDCHKTLSYLQPGTEYTFHVSTVLNNGKLSEPVCTTICTIVPAPESLNVHSVTTSSATVRWNQPHGIEETQHHYQISYHCSGKEQHIITTSSHSVALSYLKSATQYSVTVCTVLENGEKSQPVSTTYTTMLPPPDDIQVLLLTSDSVSLSWGSSQGLTGPHKFRVTWVDDGEQRSLSVKDVHKSEISGLKPGKKYQFNVATEGEDGRQSRCVSASVCTVVPPRDLKVEHLKDTSFTLHWSKTEGMEKVPQCFLISYCSPGTNPCTKKTEDCLKTLSNLQPGTEYTVSVSTMLINGEKSEPVSKTICTILPAPDQLTVDSVDTTSAAVSWSQPPGLDQSQHHYQISYHCLGTEPHITTTSSHNITLSDLQGGTQYSVTVCTVLENGRQSQLVSTTLTTTPGELTIENLKSTSLTVRLTKARGKDRIPQCFFISYCSSGTETRTLYSTTCHKTLSDLRPGTQYTISVSTVLNNGKQSKPVSTTICTILPAPDQLNVHSVKTTSAAVSWSQPPGLDRNHYQISYHCPGTEPHITTTSSHSITLSDLHPASKYLITVCTVLENGIQSQPVSTTFNTNPSPPGNLVICTYSATSAKLIWGHPDGMENIQHHFRVTWCDNASPSESFTTNEICGKVTGLTPGMEYTITVCTIDERNMESDPVCTNLHTKLTLKLFMQKLGLTQHFEEKLSLNTMLSIDGLTLGKNHTVTPESLPWCFLKELMRMNVSARDVKYTPTDEDLMNVNPLDLITALFLCSDSFLQQEMVQKMSMCQFAVPLLLPNCDTEQITLMLWALRDIVKKFRPSSQTDSKSFIEERIVLSDIPMVSFVRLGESSLSKSQILNKLLSNPQQYNDTFVHHDMECGNVPRRISDGLVEISWYFPSGNRNRDRFTKPVAVANLRGDIRSFKKQFNFLCQTSAAVFIFSDDLKVDSDILEDFSKAEIFLVVNSQRKTFSEEKCRSFTAECCINPTNVIVKEIENDAEFVKTLRSSVADIIRKSLNTLTIENMAGVARQSGILVDEDFIECQNAKKMADAITSNITDTVKFKDKQLPLQGQVWKEISQLEKERCRLRKAGGQEIEHYKSSLKRKEEELREKQQRFEMTDAMTNFITGMSSSKVELSYFLKWMQINSDILSQQNLSGLRQRYKELCRNHPEKKDIADLDRQMSDCSLGLEHFLRELGQLYEASCSLPESSLQRKQMGHLPGLCAQMLLEGFPIELVDGDASNIPLKWLSAVLTQLHTLVQSNSKIRVVTVLGVQSTGKSTLLNTMFGVQFAVSSGRCTRGAFMLLIKVNKELKEELKCDFIMIIDTEGLKSPELAQLDDSYEHDNELATLVIGLSDVTIINIAMENSTEMKDILQIVVHAFIRMKEVGKKPVCHFVHQNVSDMSAHDNNMRDRKKLLEQLNEMTKAAARMEKKENFTKFTDVMEYDPDTSSWYIPGLWHGTPPMAPVNAGYSEAVYDFKKSLMEDFRQCQSNDDMTHFLKWTQSLWESVKFEKFIFNFRNSLVADAYSSLCSEYNGWEWAFQKEMYSWIVSSETKMSNFGITDPNPQISIRNVLKDLLMEASKKLTLGEKDIQDNLVKYFDKRDGHVNLVEKYKEDFVSSAKTLRRETENTVKNTLLGAVEIKEGMAKLDDIKRSQANTMEKKVLALLQTCSQKKSDLSEQELIEEFESMWEETLSEINFSGLPERDVAQDAFLMLHDNLSTRGSHVNKMLVGSSLVDCGKTVFVVTSGGLWEKDKGLVVHWDPDHHREKQQDFCDDIITQCQDFITQKVESKTGYHDTYIKELLKMIETLQQQKNCNVSEECEVCLKLHICGIAAREFQKMNSNFIAFNDPRMCLERYKSKYLMEFKDLFHNQDQCQKKAEEFTKLLQPAVKVYVTKMIGADVVDEMKTGEGSKDYRTRGDFQFSILKHLLLDGEYDKYREYINHYERFVKDRLFDRIAKQLSKDRSLEKLEKKHLSEIVKIITEAISKIRNTTSTVKDIKTFIQNMCCALEEKLVFPKDALDSIMTLNYSANTEQFADELAAFVGEMEQSLAAEYDKGGDIKDRLRSLPFKPQDKMFISLFGCGEQCPFCCAPCEAGGKEHAKHFTSIHCPQGVTGWMNLKTRKLRTDICSSSVISDRKFNTNLTEGKPHLYKDYQTYYPDWIITGDSSMEASDYWKYVMATFNERIAKDTHARPADIPEDWKALTSDEALKSLKNSFNVT